MTVKRPAWVGWLVGHTDHRTFHVVTPSAELRGRWLEVPAGKPVTVSFDQPVRLVVLRDAAGHARCGFREPRESVSVGVVASGSTSSRDRQRQLGATHLGAAVRTAARELVPARERVQMVAEPPLTSH